MMQRRNFMLAAATAAMAGCAQPEREPSPGQTFLVAHGAWSAGWSWKKMHPLMTAAGHRLIVPTYTGLGEREHLADPANSLETHIEDLLGVIKFEELSDFVLVAHSYGGAVATGVADRVPELIRQIIYVDAFVPQHGQSLFDIMPPATVERFRAGLAEGDGWRFPPMPIPDDTSPADVQWIEKFRIPQSAKCFDTPLQLRNGDTKVPRAYIYALKRPPVDTFGPFAERARNEGWVYREIDASHSSQITAPESLTQLLTELASA
jgi:pimeloyl-ACP methyl ester carboxylesterase